MSVADDFSALDGEERSGSRGPIGGFFGVVADPKAYGAIFYMLLSLPLGIVYFTTVVTGLSISIPMLIVIIGLVILPLFLALVRLLSFVEGHITGILLGAQIPHREETFDAGEMSEGDDDVVAEGNRFWEAIKHMFKDVRTYTSMVYMALMLPLGVSYFTVAVTGFVTSIAFIFAPIAKMLGLGEHVVMDASSTDPQFVVQLAEFANSPAGLVVMMLLGFLGFFVMMHLSRGVGWVQARLAEAMLIKRR